MNCQNCHVIFITLKLTVQKMASSVFCQIITWAFFFLHLKSFIVSITLSHVCSFLPSARNVWWRAASPPGVNFQRLHSERLAVPEQRGLVRTHAHGRKIRSSEQKQGLKKCKIATTFAYKVHFHSHAASSGHILLCFAFPLTIHCFAVVFLACRFCVFFYLITCLFVVVFFAELAKAFRSEE